MAIYRVHSMIRQMPFSTLLFFKPLKQNGDTLLLNFGYGNFQCFFFNDVDEITGVNTGWNPRVELHMRKYGQKNIPSFSVEDVGYNNEGISIAASLFLPTNISKFPMVVLVHGSDSTTRSMGYYYSQAYNLAEKGIGVLLYDKRGCGKTTGNYSLATFNDLSSDAVAGIDYLKKRKDLPISKIGLMGTSQGGWICYKAAKKSKDIQFLVANVAPAVSLYQQELDRIYYTMLDEGLLQVTIDSALNYAKSYFDFIAGKISWSNFLPLIKNAEHSTFSDYIYIPKTATDEDILWWQRNEYDPAADLSTITCSVLSLFAGNDILVPSASNEKLMNEYLSKSGVKFNIKVFQNCGHDTEVYSSLKGGEWKFPEKFWIWKKKAPGFYETITEWIKVN